MKNEILIGLEEVPWFSDVDRIHSGDRPWPKEIIEVFVSAQTPPESKEKFLENLREMYPPEPPAAETPAETPQGATEGVTSCIYDQVTPPETNLTGEVPMSGEVPLTPVEQILSGDRTPLQTRRTKEVDPNLGIPVISEQITVKNSRPVNYDTCYSDFDYFDCR